MSFYVQRPINYDPDHIKQQGGWKFDEINTSKFMTCDLMQALSDVAVPTRDGKPHPNYEYRVTKHPAGHTVFVLHRFKGWYGRFIADLKAEWDDRMTDYVYDAALGVRTSFEDRYVGLREYARNILEENLRVWL